MLRITRLLDDPSQPRLRLEGRLVGDWVQVLEAEVSSTEEPSQLALDLSGVDFADARALTLLQRLTRRGLKIVACSPLLLTLLGEEERA